MARPGVPLPASMTAHVLPFQVPSGPQRLDPLTQPLGTLPLAASRLLAVGRPSPHWRRLSPGADRAVTPIHHILPPAPPAACREGRVAPAVRLISTPGTNTSAVHCTFGGASAMPFADARVAYHTFRKRLEKARTAAAEFKGAPCVGVSSVDTNALQSTTGRSKQRLADHQAPRDAAQQRQRTRTEAGAAGRMLQRKASPTAPASFAWRQALPSEGVLSWHPVCTRCSAGACGPSGGMAQGFGRALVRVHAGAQCGP